jgi:beta-N-acetylhexosaminidase
MKFFTLLVAGNLFLMASSLEKEIGSMLMVGFFGTSAKPSSQICKDIKRFNLGGVILFDYNPINHKKAKNISSTTQLKKLTKELQACANDHKLLIAIDEEGGLVQRLKSKYGFYGRYPKAITVAKKGSSYALATYQKMAKELRSYGINFNLAPVVDLAINPKNIVINRYGRAFGKDPKKVSKYAYIFIKQMHKFGVLTSLKHFPGHGSSLKDTHKGFVDVSKLWQKVELEPYKKLKNIADSVMVAHIFNSKIDPSYPASLSKKTIQGVLRKEIGFRGVVITDDLQMGAISKRYSLKKSLALAINAGNDLLLFGNQLDPKKIYSPAKLVNSIKSLVNSKVISINRIKEASKRVKRLKSRLR